MRRTSWIQHRHCAEPAGTAHRATQHRSAKPNYSVPEPTHAIANGNCASTNATHYASKTNDHPTVNRTSTNTESHQWDDTHAQRLSPVDAE